VSVPVQLLILGDGSDLAKMEQLAQELGIAGRCHFVPAAPYDMVSDYLNALDMLVLPSRTTPNWKEQFGRVLVEAMACKVAVVGSDAGAIPEVIGDAGRIFPESQPAALAAIVAELASDQAMRQSLAERGYQRALERYRVERLAADVLGIWQKIADTMSTRVLP
jgi:glycosyltransferase involved in cell wall biosynthesis